MRMEVGEGGGFGWGGVEGWGENADNCNWMTIKILKNSTILLHMRKPRGRETRQLTQDKEMKAEAAEAC